MKQTFDFDSFLTLYLNDLASMYFCVSLAD